MTKKIGMKKKNLDHEEIFKKAQELFDEKFDELKCISLVDSINSNCELRNEIRTRTRARMFAHMRCACKKAFETCVRCACVRPFFTCAMCDRNFARFSQVFG